MKKVNRQFRQGDVLLHPVSALPDGCKPVANGKAIVLAEGEVTGHAHRIKSPGRKVRQHTAGAELYLEVLEPVTVSHEEHAAVDLEPGIYHVRRQVEAWLDEVRQVAD